MALPIPRPGIMDISPYIGGEGRAGVADPVRLASNENPLGCSPKAREAYLKAADDLHRYPDGSAANLRAAIGDLNGLDPARIVCGAGSDELIALITRAYVGPGDDMVYSQYGFLMYPICAKAVGARGIAAPEKDMRTDIHAVLKSVTPKTKMVILANPNNPTGSYLSKDEMRTLRERLPEEVLLVIDSAYAEFVPGDDYSDGRELVDAFGNVIVLRTFSKAYGLAALRLGWGYMTADMAGVINRIRPTFNASVPAQAAGIAALGDQDFIKQTIEMTAAGRSMLTKGLEKMNYRVWPSVTNFLLVEFGDKAEEIRVKLKDQDIFIRQMGAYGLPTHLRISVGTESDNDRLLAAIRAIG